MRTNMKNESTYDQNGFTIEKAILDKTGLLEDSIRLIGTEGLVILEKGEMTAKDMITTIEGLVHFADKMLTELSEFCENECDDYDDCDEVYDGEFNDDFDAEDDSAEFIIKINDDNSINITPKDDDSYCLMDIQPEILDLFEEYDICLRALSRLIRSNKIIE